MATEPTALPAKSDTHSWLTLAAVAVVACVMADLVHEVLGHGTAALITGDRILSLSTVALQNVEANRFVSAAGTMANCVVGGVCLLLMRRVTRLTAAACFLWVLGTLNLLNSGYLIASAILNNGDWSNVIAGLAPGWMWRIALGLAGVVVYWLSLRWSAAALRGVAASGDLDQTSLRRLVLITYLAAGVVMTLASVFNPISPSLILFSGVGASFGLNAGMLAVPSMVTFPPAAESAEPRPIPLSITWIVLALVCGGVFVGVLGPGIRFS